ncbi:DeSI-like protein [Diplonema papillatum]|nr:DeSI-like protein [Diplonema papillatum]|eukprot:gene18754-28956_t
MYCCGGDPTGYVQERNETDVYVNVYDITSFNALIGWVGMGAHHTGVEVYGREHCFGRSSDASGVYTIQPKTCEAHIFRESIFLGRTSLTKAEVMSAVRGFQQRFHSSSYHVIRNNCNHFSEDFSAFLLGKDFIDFPPWVNRPCRSASWLLPSAAIEKIDQLDYQMFLNLRKACAEEAAERDPFMGGGLSQPRSS